MNDNELRDRIAAAISTAFVPGVILESDKQAAQAVIDELGLTVDEVDRGNTKRYVTKWLHS